MQGLVQVVEDQFEELEKSEDLTYRLAIVLSELVDPVVPAETRDRAVLKLKAAGAGEVLARLEKKMEGEAKEIMKVVLESS